METSLTLTARIEDTFIAGITVNRVAIAVNGTQVMDVHEDDLGWAMVAAPKVYAEMVREGVA